jgi:(5-formylfuran-3-yl)methyl phosphate synthase
VKISVNEWFEHTGFFAEMHKLTQGGIRLVALYFADSDIDTNSLGKLQEAGFYGAMLDTQQKQFSLPELQPKASLESYVQECAKYGLISGLAGSLKPQHVEFLQELNPTFLGFRGGVCENQTRTSLIQAEKVDKIKKMLCKHNKMNGLGQKSSNFALQT